MVRVGRIGRIGGIGGRGRIGGAYLLLVGGADLVDDAAREAGGTEFGKEAEALVGVRGHVGGAGKLRPRSQSRTGV